MMKLITTGIHPGNGKVLARTTNNLILQNSFGNDKKAFTKETNDHAKKFEGKIHTSFKRKFLKTRLASNFFK